MLRLLRKHTHFRGPTAQITDQAELANVKDKSLLLAQSELFTVELKQLQSGIPVKKVLSNCRLLTVYRLRWHHSFHGMDSTLSRNEFRN